MIEDNSACIPVAPPPPIKPIVQPPFPVGEEFIEKKKTDTEDKENVAEYGPSYPKYGRYHKVHAKYLIEVKNLADLLEPPIQIGWLYAQKRDEKCSGQIFYMKWKRVWSRTFTGCRQIEVRSTAPTQSLRCLNSYTILCVLCKEKEVCWRWILWCIKNSTLWSSLMQKRWRHMRLWYMQAGSFLGRRLCTASQTCTSNTPACRCTCFIMKKKFEEELLISNQKRFESDSMNLTLQRQLRVWTWWRCGKFRTCYMSSFLFIFGHISLWIHGNARLIECIWTTWCLGWNTVTLTNSNGFRSLLDERTFVSRICLTSSIG